MWISLVSSGRPRCPRRTFCQQRQSVWQRQQKGETPHWQMSPLSGREDVQQVFPKWACMSSGVCIRTKEEYSAGCLRRNRPTLLKLTRWRFSWKKKKAPITFISFQPKRETWRHRLMLNLLILPLRTSRLSAMIQPTAATAHRWVCADGAWLLCDSSWRCGFILWRSTGERRILQRDPAKVSQASRGGNTWAGDASMLLLSFNPGREELFEWIKGPDLFTTHFSIIFSNNCDIIRPWKRDIKM